MLIDGNHLSNSNHVTLKQTATSFTKNNLNHKIGCYQNLMILFYFLNVVKKIFVKFEKTSFSVTLYVEFNRKNAYILYCEKV